MTHSSETPESVNSDNLGNDPAIHAFGSAACEPAGLIGDHWLEMTATIPLSRTEDFAAWMDRQLALAESDLADYATAKSTAR